MANTGAPYFIPYVEPTDLVRDYPAADEASADAIADALGNLQTELDGAGGLVAVKTVTKTDTFSVSLGINATSAVTGLSITHTVANAANKVILMYTLGSVTVSDPSFPGGPGVFVTDDGTAILVGAAQGARPRAFTASNGSKSGGLDDRLSSSQNGTVVHTPGDTASHVYSVSLRSVTDGTYTHFVNRSVGDSNSSNFARTASTLTLMEVKV